jgi:hypothetical protein
MPAQPKEKTAKTANAKNILINFLITRSPPFPKGCKYQIFQRDMYGPLFYKKSAVVKKKIRTSEKVPKSPRDVSLFFGRILLCALLGLRTFRSARHNRFLPPSPFYIDLFIYLNLSFVKNFLRTFLEPL